MPIRISCPCCNRVMNVSDDLAGRRVRCPDCGEVIAVQGPETEEHGAISRAPVPRAPRPSRRPAPAPARNDDDDEPVERRPRQKHCVECGALIRANASVCPRCGVPQTASERRERKHCHECGAVIRGNAAVCSHCGVTQDAASGSGGTPGSGRRVAAGICGILLGGLGVHKFIAGLVGPAVIMLSVSLGGVLVGVCGGFFCIIPAVFLLAPFAMGVIGLVEGIIYLTKSDDEFHRAYVVGQKGWF